MKKSRFKPSDLKGFKHIAPYLKPHKWGFLFGIILLSLSGVLTLIVTRLWGQLGGVGVLGDAEKHADSASKGIEAEIIETMDLELAIPKYLEMPGWSKSTAGQTSYNELDDNAKSFIEKIEEISGVPVIMISTGPKREDTIIRQDI